MLQRSLTISVHHTRVKAIIKLLYIIQTYVNRAVRLAKEKIKEDVSTVFIIRRVKMQRRQN